MNYKDFNDYELISLVAENHEDAERVIYDKYRPLIIAKANQYFNAVKYKGVEMNDLIQEGFIGLSEAIQGYKDNRDAQFKTFATLCIDRQIKTYLSKVNRQKHHHLNSSISFNYQFSSGDSLIDALSDGQPSPIQKLITKERVDELVALVDEVLTDFEREVFKLKVANFTYREIATILETTPKVVDNALQRIKAKARKVMVNN